MVTFSFLNITRYYQYKIDPRHLSLDELNYEFSLRGINASDSDAIKRLIHELPAEEMGESPNPMDLHRITRETVAQEIKICERNLINISDLFFGAVKGADDEKISEVQSRFAHIKGRVARLKIAAPNHNGVDRLVEKVNSGESHIRVARDSIGSGEQITNTSEADRNAIADELLNNEEGAVGGALTDESSHMQILNQQEQIQKPNTNKGGLKRILGSISDLFTGYNEPNYQIHPTAQQAFMHK